MHVTVNGVLLSQSTSNARDSKRCTSVTELSNAHDSKSQQKKKCIFFRMGMLVNLYEDDLHWIPMVSNLSTPAWRLVLNS